MLTPFLPSLRLLFGRPCAFKVELRVYPGADHFDIYDGPSHEAVVADEIEFLHRHLLGRSLCGTPVQRRLLAHRVA
jgi:hypothetical protein